MITRSGLVFSDGAAGPLLQPDPDATWPGAALCAQADPALFYPPPGGDTRQPKQVCARCPVRAECLEHALRRGEAHGVWGGMSPQERRAELRRRRAAGRELAA